MTQVPLLKINMLPRKADVSQLLLVNVAEFREGAETIYLGLGLTLSFLTELTPKLEAIPTG